MLKVITLKKLKKLIKSRICQKICPNVKNDNVDNFRIYANFDPESAKINFKIDFTKMSISDVWFG